MPAPTYSAGTIGNVIARQSLAAGKVAAGLLDLTTGGLNSQGDVEGQLTCKVVIGASSPSAGTVFSPYKIYGPSTTISTFTDSTHIVVASGSDIDVGQKIFIAKAGATNTGETAVVSAVSGGNLTLSAALTNTYATNDHVYLISQTPGQPTTPSNAGAWPANSVQSATLFIGGAAPWCIEAKNTDGGATVTVVATADTITGFQ